MNRVHWLICATTCASLGGCAVNPPLMFGDHLTFGLQLGTDVSASGGSVTLGYKQRSVAVVPVSVLNENGEARALRGVNGSDRDALSVFAVFESSAPGANDRVRLGQVFSTGMAAQALTKGYECQMGGKADCFASLPVAAAASAVPAPLPESSAPTTDRPYQKPLVYASTNVLGIDIGGSSAEQGVGFALGYTGRNLALVPVYAPGSGQRVTSLFGGAGEGPGSRDAYSVLGQFKANTQTKGLGFGIERYFATGIAAQNLGQGMGSAIAAARPASAAPVATTAAPLVASTR